MQNKILSLVLLLALPLAHLPHASAFSDVQEGDPYFEALDYLQDQGIVSGYADGTFQVDNLINRAEFTKIVVGATHSYKQYAYYTGNCFPDVGEEWFAPYVCAAQSEGIIDGYPNGFFGPDQNVNFAEAAKIIVNSFGYAVAAGDPWYAPYEAILSQEYATPTSILSPDQEITRGEMAEIIYRLHSKSSQNTSISGCDLYTYQDTYYGGVGRHCINQVTVKPIYFVALDQTDELIPNWKENMTDIFGETKSFYENEFDNKIDITIDEPEIRYGEKNIDEYISIYDDVFKSEATEQVSSDHYTIFSVYYDGVSAYGGASLIDGTYPSDDIHNNGSFSLNPAFWLEDDGLCTVESKYGTACYGYVGSAHELGHSLGMPHPWEMASNKDLQGNMLDPTFKFSEVGNIMAYGGTGLLSGDTSDPLGGYFVMEEAKEIMLAE